VESCQEYGTKQLLWSLLLEVADKEGKNKGL
jgi:hypothetical protein